MGKRLRFFVLGAVFGAVGVSLYIMSLKNSGEVLSYKTVLRIPTETQIPTSTPTPTPTPTTTPTPTVTPTPTMTPTPTATPTPLPPPAPYSQLEEYFNRYAGAYGIDVNLLKKIADCETENNSSAVNGGYVGLYQFNADSWASNRQEMGFDANPILRFNAEESVRTAAYLISKGKLFMWPNCIND